MSYSNNVPIIDPNYTPRYYQLPVFKAFAEGIKRVVLVWHRRAGKDKTCWELLLSQAYKTAGNYWYMFPEYTQGRKAFWQSIDSQGKRIIDYIPPQLHYRNPSDQEMTIYLKTEANVTGKDPKSHSTIQVVGSDKPDSLRGSNPKGVICSEYAEWKRPSVFEAIVEPILSENGGWALFNYTPRGMTAAYYLYKAAQSNPNWFTSLLTIEDTHKPDPRNPSQLIPVVSQETIQDIRSRGQTSEDTIQQEYYCSFTAAVAGTYYSKQMDALQSLNQIRFQPYNPKLRTYTSWDLGLDGTAVWFIQYDPTNQALYAIDYREYVDTPLPTACAEICKLPYRRDVDIAPHDVVHRSFESGLTRITLAKQNGINFTDDATGTINKAKKILIVDKIELVHQILPSMVFNEAATLEGVECLRNYRREWDEVKGIYSDKPVHDKFSHGADALATFAVWWEVNRKREAQRLNPIQINAIIEDNYLR
jgi:hypothetical protein